MKKYYFTKNYNILKSNFFKTNKTTSINKSVPKFEKNILKLDLINKDIYVLTKKQDEFKNTIFLLKKVFFKIYIKYIISIKNNEELLLRNQKLKNKINILKYNKIDNIKLELNKKIKNLKVKNIDLEEDLKQSKLKIQDLNNKIKKFKMEINDKNKEIYSNNNNLNLIKNEFPNYDNNIVFNINNLKYNIENYKKKIEFLKNDKIKDENEINNLITSNSLLDKENIYLKLDYKNLANKNRNIISLIKKINNELNLDINNSDDIIVIINEFKTKFIYEISQKDYFQKKINLMKNTFDNIKNLLKEYLDKDFIYNNDYKETLIKNLTRFNENYNKLQSEILYLNNIITDKDNNIDILEHKLQEKNIKNIDLNKIFIITKTANSKLKKINLDLESKFKEIQDKLNKNTIEYNNKLKSFNNINLIWKENYDKIKYLNEEILALKTLNLNSVDKDKYNIDVNNLNNNINSLQNKLFKEKTNFEDKLIEYKNNLNNKEKLIKSLELKKDWFEPKIIQLETENIKLNKNLKKFELKNKNLLNDKLWENNKFTEELELITSKISNLLIKNEKLELKILNKKNIIGSLNNNLDEFKWQTETLKKELQSKNKLLKLLKIKEPTNNSSNNINKQVIINKKNLLDSKIKALNLELIEFEENTKELENYLKNDKENIFLKILVIKSEVQFLKNKSLKYQKLLN